MGVMNGDADYLQRRQSLEPRYTQRLVYEQEAGLPFTLCLVGTRGELRAGTASRGSGTSGALICSASRTLTSSAASSWRSGRHSSGRSPPTPWRPWPSSRPRSTAASTTEEEEQREFQAQPGVSEENNYLQPSGSCQGNVMTQTILNSNAISDFLLLRCLVRLVFIDPFAKLSQKLPERQCRGG